MNVEEEKSMGNGLVVLESRRVRVALGTPASESFQAT